MQFAVSASGTSHFVADIFGQADHRLWKSLSANLPCLTQYYHDHLPHIAVEAKNPLAIVSVIPVDTVRKQWCVEYKSDAVNDLFSHQCI